MRIQRPNFYTIVLIATILLSYTALSAQLSLDFETTPPACRNSQDGSIITQVNNGIGPFQYSWNTGDTTASLNNLGQGLYALTITDFNGEQVRTNIPLIAPSALHLEVDFTGSICFNPGDVEVIASGGTPPYEFVWSNGEHSDSQSGLESGLYTAQVIDANGCFAEAFIQIPDILSVQIETEAVGCLNGANGRAEAIVQGGVAPYAYFWMNEDTTAVISDLTSGNYSVFIIDGNGCVAFADALVENSIPISLELETTQPECNTPGRIISNVEGGSTPYSFEWNTGDTTANINEVAPGDYTLTLTDANGCIRIIEEEILPPTDLTATLQIEQNCDNNWLDLDINISGGVAPYSIIWNDTLFQENLLEQEPGSELSWQVIDSLDCRLSFLDTLPDFLQIDLQIDKQIPSCYGAEDGAILIHPTGGIGAYNFEWNTGDVIDSLLYLSSGSYDLTVSDSMSCPAITQIVLTEPEPLNCSVELIKFLSQPGAQDASVKVSAEGGTLPYEFLWNNGNNIIQPDSLASGMWRVTVTDANECQCSCELELKEPAMIGNYTWIDGNENGLQDDNEPGLSDVWIFLSGYSEEGLEINKDTFSNINGYYNFVVPPGNYSVFFESPAPFLISPSNVGNADISSSPNSLTGETSGFIVEAGEERNNIDAGFIPKCKNISTAGIISGAQSLCGPGVDPLPITNLEFPQGGESDLEYAWLQSNPDAEFNENDWQMIEGAHEASYDPGPIFETTTFIRCVRRADCSTYFESNPIIIYIGNEAVAEMILPDLPICARQTVTFSALDNGPAAHYFWDFGPGATPMTATTREVEVSWNDFGLRTIRLLVSKDDCISMAEERLMITTGPTYCSDYPLVGDLDAFQATNVKAPWSVYPNPVNDFLVVQLPTNQNSHSASVALYSIEGKELLFAKLNLEQENQILLLGHLPPGIYLLKFKQDDHLVEVKKVIKQ